MRNLIFKILILFFFCNSKGQTSDTLYTHSGYLKIKNNPDSVAYSKDYYLNEGVYLSHEDFREGNAVPRSLILTSVEKNQLDFYGKLVEKTDTLIFRSGQGINVFLMDSVFGFVQNNTVYVNVEGTFCRVAVFGNISHFIGSITIESFQHPGNFYDARMQNGGSSITGIPMRTKEIRPFLFDFYSGEITLANTENFERLIQKDKELCSEYRELSKNQQRKKMNLFIKKYNERNKFYFPKA